MIVRAALFAVLLTGCTGGSAAVLSKDSQQANHRITGTWNVMLSLERPYPLELRDPPTRRICGTIGFVDGESKNEKGVRESAGVYHLDLARLGLDWLDDAKFPAAIALQAGGIDHRAANVDSVSITLNPDSQEHIVLRGLYKTAGIAGSWTAQSSRGTATGAFTLQPHVLGSDVLTC